MSNLFVIMKKIVLIPVSLIVFLLIFSSIVYWQIYHKNFSINNIITIEIKEGDGVRPLTERLEREGAVPSAVVLRKFLSFKGVDRKIQSGMYTFVPPFSVVTIADTLLHPEKSEVEVTIIPGTDMRDITNYLFGQGFGTEEEIAGIIGKSAVMYTKPFVRPSWFEQYALAKHIPKTATLEGYLAPDTYRVFAHASVDDVLEKVFAERDSQFTEQMYTDIASQKRTVHEIIIMASVLEREVRTPEDRKKVADLFWRRYDMGWALQADSTVHYVVNKKGDVYTTAKDRQTDSLWNTYKYPGLPEGPISTPSISAIMAAIYPEKNEYWYFLTTQEGRVVYGKTLEEHNANKVHLQ